MNIRIALQNRNIRIAAYVVLNHVMWWMGVAMCYIDRLIDNIGNDVQSFLITFFPFLAWVVLVVGAIDTMPKDPYSNMRIWFFSAIMGGSLAGIRTFIELITPLIA